ncbi:MAG: hypothetical protein PHY31_01415, partial [Smithellaceae bacterium]|nr:hypothetical protein [Smithellaceae bacterium]
GGMVAIDSQADTGRRIYAVIVPHLVCPMCRQHAEEIYGLTNSGGKYQQVFFQDRERDIFLVK